jgi:ribose transport system substrate-binding protein
MAGQALQLGVEVLKGNKPAEPVVLLDPQLITADNIKDYKGWTAAR